MVLPSGDQQATIGGDECESCAVIDGRGWTRRGGRPSVVVRMDWSASEKMGGV
jgi:hypothetical protein